MLHFFITFEFIACLVVHVRFLIDAKSIFNRIEMKFQRVGSELCLCF
jgi:hypothetical protein